MRNEVRKIGAKLTDEAQAWISQKIKKLIGEGKSQEQAAAIAYDMARREGYDVPKRSRRPDIEETITDLLREVIESPDASLKSGAYRTVVQFGDRAVPILEAQLNYDTENAGVYTLILRSIGSRAALDVLESAGYGTKQGEKKMRKHAEEERTPETEETEPGESELKDLIEDAMVDEVKAPGEYQELAESLTSDENGEAEGLVDEIILDEQSHQEKLVEVADSQGLDGQKLIDEATAEAFGENSDSKPSPSEKSKKPEPEAEEAKEATRILRTAWSKQGSTYGMYLMPNGELARVSGDGSVGYYDAKTMQHTDTPIDDFGGPRKAIQELVRQGGKRVGSGTINMGQRKQATVHGAYQMPDGEVAIVQGDGSVGYYEYGPTHVLRPVKISQPNRWGGDTKTDKLGDDPQSAIEQLLARGGKKLQASLKFSVTPPGFEHVVKIEKNGENETWAVHSDSGNVYEVRFLGMDGELRRWACSCPAGEHGRKCKHAVAVADQTASTAEDEGMDAGGGDIFGCRPNSSSGRPMADRQPGGKKGARKPDYNQLIEQIRVGDVFQGSGFKSFRITNITDTGSRADIPEARWDSFVATVEYLDEELQPTGRKGTWALGAIGVNLGDGNLEKVEGGKMGMRKHGAKLEEGFDFSLGLGAEFELEDIDAEFEDSRGRNDLIEENVNFILDREFGQGTYHAEFAPDGINTEVDEVDPNQGWVNFTSSLYFGISDQSGNQVAIAEGGALGMADNSGEGGTLSHITIRITEVTGHEAEGMRRRLQAMQSDRQVFDRYFEKNAHQVWQALERERRGDMEYLREALKRGDQTPEGIMATQGIGGLFRAASTHVTGITLRDTAEDLFRDQVLAEIIPTKKEADHYTKHFQSIPSKVLAQSIGRLEQREAAKSLTITEQGELNLLREEYKRRGQDPEKNLVDDRTMKSPDLKGGGEVKPRKEGRRKVGAKFGPLATLLTQKSDRGQTDVIQNIQRILDGEDLRGFEPDELEMVENLVNSVAAEATGEVAQEIQEVRDSIDTYSGGGNEVEGQRKTAVNPFRLGDEVKDQSGRIGRVIEVNPPYNGIEGVVIEWDEDQEREEYLSSESDWNELEKMGQRKTATLPDDYQGPIKGGFSISTTDQFEIEQNAEERGITLDDAAWDQLNQDVALLEENTEAWLKTVVNWAQNEGHDHDGDLSGSFDATPESPLYNAIIESSEEGIGEPLRFGAMPPYDLGAYADEGKLKEGVSGIGQQLLDVTLNFFAVEPDTEGEPQAPEKTSRRKVGGTPDIRNLAYQAGLHAAQDAWMFESADDILKQMEQDLDKMGPGDDAESLVQHWQQSWESTDQFASHLRKVVEQSEGEGEDMVEDHLEISEGFWEGVDAGLGERGINVWKLARQLVPERPKGKTPRKPQAPEKTSRRKIGAGGGAYDVGVQAAEAGIAVSADQVREEMTGQLRYANHSEDLVQAWLEYLGRNADLDTYSQQVMDLAGDLVAGEEGFEEQLDRYYDLMEQFHEGLFQGLSKQGIEVYQIAKEVWEQSGKPQTPKGKVKQSARFTQ